jgi:hypothetical protein
LHFTWTPNNNADSVCTQEHGWSTDISSLSAVPVVMADFLAQPFAAGMRLSHAHNGNGSNISSFGVNSNASTTVAADPDDGVDADPDATGGGSRTSDMLIAPQEKE